MREEPSASATEIGGYRIIRTLSKSAALDVLLASKKTSNGSECTYVLRVVSEKFARDERFAKAFVREAAVAR